MKWIIRAILIFIAFDILIELIQKYPLFIIAFFFLAILFLIWLKKKGFLPALFHKTYKKRILTEETFHAVGVSHYESSIRKLAYSNPDWKLNSTQIIKAGKTEKRIFKHNYVNRPVKLEAEPNNPYDPNAIMVLFAGEHVGYISKDDNLHVKDILNNREIISLSGFIGGGEYKLVSQNGDTVNAEINFSVNVRIKYI